MERDEALAREVAKESASEGRRRRGNNVVDDVVEIQRKLLERYSGKVDTSDEKKSKTAHKLSQSPPPKSKRPRDDSDEDEDSEGHDNNPNIGATRRTVKKARRDTALDKQKEVLRSGSPASEKQENDASDSDPPHQRRMKRRVHTKIGRSASSHDQSIVSTPKLLYFIDTTDTKPATEQRTTTRRSRSSTFISRLFT